MRGSVSVRGLWAGYAAGDVLRGVSFDIASGELVGLIGPNGSGKTTLVRAITGVVPARRGVVEVSGAPVHRLSPIEVARRVAVVPQVPTLPPGFTVADVVAMGRTPHLGLFGREDARDRRAIRFALEITDTMRFADRRAGELSGGEMQRVVIARALAQGAGVLLLDEPTSHLDLGHQAEVLGLIRRLQVECRLTVLAVLHDLTLAAQLCRRLVVLHQGQVAADGPPAEVLTGPLLEKVYGPRVCLLQADGGMPVVVPALSRERGCSASGPALAELVDQLRGETE